MGCNKSKSQHRASEAHINGEHTIPWVLGQEANSLYGENIEFHQNGTSNIGYYPGSSLNYQQSGDQFRDNSDQQTGYGYSDVTGFVNESFPDYKVTGFNHLHYSNTNEYNASFNNNYCANGPNNQHLSVLNDPTFNHFSHEQFQSTFFQHKYHNQTQYQNKFNQEQIYGELYHGPIMGPPSRSISKPAKSNYGKPYLLRPLARRRSFNDDYRRANGNTHHTMVRHISLENIPAAFRTRHYRTNFSGDNNLYWNNSVGREEYLSYYTPRWRNSERRGQRRGLKRNSCDDDSMNSNTISSDNSASVSENVVLPEVGPCLKRRPSDIKDPYHSSADVSSEDTKETKEEINSNNDTKSVDKSVEQLNLCDETFGILDLLLFPEEWSSCAMDKTGLVDISSTSLEGIAVQRYFNRSSQTKDFKLCITALARIENPFMHSYYLLKKQEMESRNENVDELYLYHGTKKEYLSGILNENLNWRLYSENHRFGQGVSFSPLATYSSHYSDKSSEKVMLLFKVLVSNSISGSPDMKIPPTSDNVVYDASVKDDTSVIVKYSDNEFYPLYKITYVKRMRH